MTDITELAQRMKAAAVRAKAATEDYVAHRMSITVYLEECKEFNDLSDGPDNILALVEALEKAQSELAKANGVLDKIQSTSCHADTSDGSFIPNSLDAWGRPVPQHLSYDFSGNPGASATQYCNGWNEAGGYWLNYVRELESCTVTVKLPKPISVLHRREFTEAHCAIYAYPEAEVNAALDDSGIKWEAE
ncbi:Uncharacterised protein [Raoultella terrigena]|uniref:hypothetical protein n=1 Tax=Raoultella terrigena TaxID=577 RepID=UPI00116483C4|nr:hypothetical protein [Raoultella terrigena]VUC79815.1 Uncharacterised protein [Raoultella terrigena]